MTDIPHVKKLDRKSRIKPTLHFFSRKNNRMLFCESYFEAECCLFREFDSNVIAYATQPITYSYDYYGKSRSYTPDALVQYKDGYSEFEEIKPITEALKQKFIDKFEYLKVVHNEVIKIPLILNNGRFKSNTHKVNCEQLYNCLAMPFDSDYWNDNYEYFPQSVSLFDLQQYLINSDLYANIAFQLIARGLYLTDLKIKLSPTSKLEKNHVTLK